MPCSDGRTDLDCAREWHERCDLATRLLCKMIKHFGVIPGDEELAKWKAEHDEQDRRREAAEEAERVRHAEAERQRSVALQALAKLTPQEIEALNVCRKRG